MHTRELHYAELIELGSVTSETTGASIIGTLETETGQRYPIFGLLSYD